MTRQAVDRERGSAMVMAVFVLFLLTSTGVALLFLSRSEAQMSKANLRASQAFYLAEGALEEARQRIYDLNGLNEFDDDLLAAAGGTVDGIDVDPASVTPIFDSNGNLTGVNGVGDDVPLISLQSVGGGQIVAYLTNDPFEGRATTTDSNDRLALVGIGAGPDRSFEVVEAVIERRPPMPLVPPSTITMLGPPPAFESATSKVKDYSGDDCAGTSYSGQLGLYVPIVGTLSDSAESQVDAGRNGNPQWYLNGALDPDDGESASIANLLDPDNEPSMQGPGAIGFDPAWNDCATLKAMLEDLEDRADYVCRSSYCDFPDYGPDTLIFIDGDYSLGPTQSGQGIIVCTGEFVLNGRTDWNGLIMVVGEGQYRMNGSGNGEVIGGMVIADIAGPDGVYGTGDDCESGSSGLGQAGFDENGGGNALTVYCSTALNSTNVRPYKVVEFAQH